MKTIILFLTLCSTFAFSQGLYNNGAKIVVQSGGNIYVNGNYQAESISGNHAEIDLDGDFFLAGNFENNVSAGNGFLRQDLDGTLHIVGATPQYWLGTNINLLELENLTLASDAYMDFSLLGVTVYGSMALNGNTFQAKVGDVDFEVIGTISGSGLFDVSEAGHLVRTPAQNTPLLFPIGDGNYNESVTITCLNVPSEQIMVKISSEPVTSSYFLWDIDGESNLNATALFRIDKTAISAANPLLNNMLRYYNGVRYVPFSDERVTISDMDTYFNITITSINQF